MKPPHRPGDNPGGSGPLLSGPETELHRCSSPQGNPQVVPTVGTETACRISGATLRQAQTWTEDRLINLVAVRAGSTCRKEWTRLHVAHLAAARILAETIADIALAARIGNVVARCACVGGDRYVVAGRDHIVTTDDHAAALHLLAQMHGVVTVVDTRIALSGVLAAFDEETRR